MKVGFCFFLYLLYSDERIKDLKLKPEVSSIQCSLKNYHVPGSATIANKMNELSACMGPTGQQETKCIHSLTQGTQSKCKCKM